MVKIEPVFTGFDYAGASLLDELRKNITTLFGTPEGTVPGDRHFGINTEFVGKPGPVVQNLLSLEIIEKVNEYEPRLAVKNITFEHNMDGHVKALVLLAANQYYEETDEESDEEIEEEEEEEEVVD